MDLVVIAVIVTVLWIGVLGFYIYSSRQHHDLQRDIESLQRMLGEEHDDES